jgi:hypothetical protein
MAKRGENKMFMKKNAIIEVLVVIFLIAPNCFAGTTATVTVTATVLEGESSISVDVALVNFGGVSGSLSNRRFVAGPVQVSYFAATRPWTIRVYTVNPGGVPGLIGVTDSSQSIPLKVWCDNYGPWEHQPGIPPNEENIYFWNGYSFNGDNDKEDIITDGSISEIALEVNGLDVNGDGDALDTGLGTPQKPVSEEPSWLRVPDWVQMKPDDPYTWRRLLTQAWAEAPGSGSGGGSGDPYKFPVFFGIDVTGIAPQQYRTTTLTFQIIGE